MPNVDDVIEWDFIAIVDCWNLYGLPALLTVVVIATLVRSRSRAVATAWQLGSRTVLLIALIHCVFALHALMSLAQVLVTLRVMGIPESFVSPVSAVFSAVVNPVLAIGLLRRSRWARRLAIAWYVFLSLLAVLVVSWLWYYRVAVELATWPDQLIAKVLPVFLLVVMLLPRIKRVFEAQTRAKPAGQPGRPEEAPPLGGWSVLSLLTLLFLIVACSNLVVNATDWGYRQIFDSEAL